jgi:dihydroorotate dehydrogenase electron transfer subunit
MQVTCASDITTLSPHGGLEWPTGRHAVADFKATVLANRQVNPEYFHLILRGSGPALSARAGQFFNLECPPSGEETPYLRRPMSVFKADAERGEVEFLYKVTGAGTRGMATLSEGQRMRIFGPLGNGFSLDAAWKNVLVVGRGVGLATLAPLAELAASSGIGVTAVLSARSNALLMSVERFAATGARVETVTDEDLTSHPDAVERLIRDLIHRNLANAFFTCGSNRLMLLLKRLEAEFNIPGQIAMEQQMACGIGMCFCCVRNFDVGGAVEQRRVCFEGPVFDLSEALPW